MKNIFLGLSLLTVITFCTNCKNDDDASPNYNTSESGEYFPLAIGNYWIYQEERFNNISFSGTLTGREDTVRVVDQKELVGIDFFVLETTYVLNNQLRSITSYIRDSSGYLINQKGEVQFSAIAPNEILHTNEFNSNLNVLIEYAVSDSIVFKVTNAGAFPCLDFEGSIYIDGALIEAKNHVYYSKGVGPVWKTQSYISGILEERKLLKEYYIQ